MGRLLLIRNVNVSDMALVLLAYALKPALVTNMVERSEEGNRCNALKIVLLGSYENLENEIFRLSC